MCIGVYLCGDMCVQAVPTEVRRVQQTPAVGATGAWCGSWEGDSVKEQNAL